jgi:hypothetical protein
MSYQTISSELLTDVVGTYDQTKTTIQGRVAQKTVLSQNVVGPPLTNYIDLVTDTGLAPVGVHRITSNGRMFVILPVVAGTMSIALYTFNLTTAAYTYVGRINVAIPNTAATTHTYRSLRVLDSGTTGWKIFFTTTGSVLINGGTFLINNISLSDFVPIGFPTIQFATDNDQKAVYFLQDPSNIGVNQLQTASAGSALDTTNNILYVHNGVSATHQYFKYDTSVAPTYAKQTFTVTVASPGVVTAAAHGLSNNDPVVLFTTGALPTGLVAGTVYFVRNATTNTFELSATSGGASINTSGTQSGTHSVGRAYGTTGSNFIHKTGNLPALTGTLVILDAEDYAVPSHTTNSGQPCVFFTTNTNLYIGRLSDLTSGATTWPTLVTSNVLGATNEITTPTVAFAQWVQDLDAAIYVTNTTRFVIKQIVNNVIRENFGALNNLYLEGTTKPSIDLGFVSILGMSARNGFLTVVGGTTGQRVITYIDLRSDATRDYSYVVTKVLDTPNSTLKSFDTIEAAYEYTGETVVQYRSSGFGSISGGWTTIPNGSDLSSYAIGNQTQFKLLFDITSEFAGSPAQLVDFLVTIQSNNAISDNWEYSRDDSSSGSPTRASFRLKRVYSTSVPTIYFRAYDLTNVLLVNHNTVTNAANFEYSTDNGTTWLPLGTIPNTVGTLIRYSFTSPPGVDFRPSVRES